MKYIKQICIIMTISFVAELMEYLIPLPIAASVYGLILMLIGLVTKIIPLGAVEEVSDWLVEIMPILFVPPTVSLMANVDALKAMLIPLTVICIVTTVLIMGVTGRVTQRIMRMNHKKKEASSPSNEQEMKATNHNGSKEEGK